MRVEYVEQATLDGATKRIPVRHRFDSPTVSELRHILEAAQHECWTCGDNGYEVDGERGYNVRPIEVYDDPWADAPDIIWAHDSERRPVPYNVAQSCMEAIESPDVTDFHYFTCDACYRQVIVRAPRNGWHTYSRIINECEQWCLACVEDTLRREGIAGFEVELEALFTEGRLFGMFFNVGDLEAAGWMGHDYRTFIDCEERAMALAAEAKRLHEQGRLILIGYESLAIGASEGYVTLFSKTAARCDRCDIPGPEGQPCRRCDGQGTHRMIDRARIAAVAASRRTDKGQRGLLPYSVGLADVSGSMMGRFETEQEAAEFIATLEGYEDGRYYLDGPPCEGGQ